MTSPSLRLIGLHLRSRATGRSVLLLAGTATALRLCLPWTEGTGTGAQRMFSEMVLLLVGVAGAAIVATGIRSPFGEAERAGRPLPRLRLLHVAVLAVAAGTLLLAGGLAPSTDTIALLRDLGGLTGIALLTACLLGSHLSWITPLAYVVVCGGALDFDQTSLWTWPVLPAGDRTALVVAGVLLAAGTVATTVTGPRDHITDLL
ncbi:MAG: hypothetical protein JWQ95_3721 [Sphaerisporangium sp.]|jgi:hypothetical protein|nr:hypothetical protein [Sphaerisporangium sp.]